METLIKRISKARKHATDPLDEPWHLGILHQLDKYGISQFSSDAIDAILKVQNWLMDASTKARIDVQYKKKDIEKLGPSLFAYLFSTLSIRQAKCIAALHRTVGKDIKYLWLVFHKNIMQHSRGIIMHWRRFIPSPMLWNCLV